MIDRVVASLHNDVVDGDVDQLDEEANEAHHREADSSGNRNLLQLCAVGKRRVIE